MDFLIVIDKSDKPMGISLGEQEQVFAKGSILIKQIRTEKFNNDCVFFESNNKFYILNGAILNLQDLKIKYGSTTEDTILKLYTEFGEKLSLELEGSFIGSVVNENKNEILVYSDILGNHPIYYYMDSKSIIISDKIFTILKQIKFMKKNVSINMIGAYSMLTYGYMYENNTLLNEIKRVTPGRCIKINDYTDIKELTLYQLPNKIKNITETEAIKIIDDLFKKAIDLQVRKNVEYGYDNYTALSAGMDSRVVAFELRRREIENTVLFTYSETDQYDEVIPQKISSILQYKWIFKSLDNGLDLMEIDESIDISDGRIYYPWTSQLNSFLKLINHNKVGIINTGVIGDVVIGTFYHDYNGESKKYKIGDGAYSSILIPRLKTYLKELNKYKDYEEGMLYNRAFNGACLGYSTTFQRYTEALSPFMNRRLFDFCLSLPVDMRYQHNLYYKWVRKCYPEACKFTHNGMKVPESSLFIKLGNKKIYIDTIYSRTKGIIKSKINKNYGMNPLQYWYNSNDKLKNVMDKEFNDTKYILEEEKDLYNDLEYLYSIGSAIDKLLCISLVATLKKIMEI